MSQIPIAQNVAITEHVDEYGEELFDQDRQFQGQEMLSGVLATEPVGYDVRAMGPMQQNYFMYKKQRRRMQGKSKSKHRQMGHVPVMPMQSQQEGAEWPLEEEDSDYEPE